MGFWKRCDNLRCKSSYDDDRTKLDAPTPREVLTRTYTCPICETVQYISDVDRDNALGELFDKVEALEERLDMLS